MKQISISEHLHDILRLTHIQSEFVQDSQTLLLCSASVFLFGAFQSLRKLFESSGYRIMSLWEAVYRNMANLQLLCFLLTPFLMWAGNKDVSLDRNYRVYVFRTRIHFVSCARFLLQVRRAFCIAFAYFIGCFCAFFFVCKVNDSLVWTVSFVENPGVTNQYHPFGVCIWQFVCIFLFLLFLGCLIRMVFVLSKNKPLTLAISFGVVLLSYLRYNPLAEIPTLLMFYIVEFSMHIVPTLVFSIIVIIGMLFITIRKSLKEDFF